MTKRNKTVDDAASWFASLLCVAKIDPEGRALFPLVGNVATGAA